METADDIDKKLVQGIVLIPESRLRGWFHYSMSGLQWRNKQGNAMLDPLCPILELQNMDFNKVTHWLARCITEIRRKERSPYPPNTLHS